MYGVNDGYAAQQIETSINKHGQRQQHYVTTTTEITATKRESVTFARHT